MGNFLPFQKAVMKQLDKMTKTMVYTTGISKDDMWELYLNSFPEGTNPIFRERREHDCQCCKQFIRACGNVVSIVNHKLVSIWDLKDLDDTYQPVADALSRYVKSAPIENIFLYYQKNLGTHHNHQLLENEKFIRWNHFFYELPRQFVASKYTIGTKMAMHKNNQGVLKRGLEEISLGAAETVLELIDQNSIYRGSEHKQAVVSFIKLKKQFSKLKTVSAKDNLCWELSHFPGIRNTVIGTLINDISTGVPLDDAVRMFESKVAPTNYKRPNAIITKSMIKNAQKTVEELGIESSLHRRYAVPEDLNINNVIFADRGTQKSMQGTSVFDQLTETLPVDPKSLKKVDDVSIDDFLNTILPKASQLEIMFENKHENNLMSLIAPENPEAPPIFKWGNNFSWTYNGEVADSIRERVRKAGGNVSGVLRCSLSWFNRDDLDIHVIEPNGNHIYFGNRGRRHISSGMLDVDMNVSDPVRDAVENIVWTNLNEMQTGKYKVYIHNYTPRETIDVGFDVEIEYNGEILTFHYGKAVRGNVTVAEFNFSKTGGLKILKSIESTSASKNIWGIDSNKFHKVALVMNSPNHWDGEKTGNKHYFFILDGCHNDNKARGFFNEFLNEGLTEHRKVFEILGNTLRVEKADRQLSGLGFSSTRKDSVLCKVSGSFERVVRINF